MRLYGHNSLAKARGLSLRTGAQTMLYLLLRGCFIGLRWPDLVIYNDETIVKYLQRYLMIKYQIDLYFWKTSGASNYFPTYETVCSFLTVLGNSFLSMG